jgi:hypothetical protein
MKRGLTIAAALAHHPALVFLNEPLRETYLSVIYDTRRNDIVHYITYQEDVIL